MDRCILTLNAGSSSLKFALYSIGATERRLAVGNLDRIGLSGGYFRGQSDQGAIDESGQFRNHAEAIARLFAWLAGRTIDAIRYYREQTGADLKESKEAVEALAATR